MLSSKEKDLAIKLLESQIERMSGKKIIYRESAPLANIEEAKKKKEKEDSFSRKKKIAKALKESMDAGCKMEEIDEVVGLFKRMGDKIGQAMGTKWTPEQAEKEYNAKYAKTAQAQATKFGTDVATYKTAIVNFMTAAGGMAILAGQGQNAGWDASSKSFKQMASKTGGPGGNVMGEEIK